jgi:hypothetical protein
MGDFGNFRAVPHHPAHYQKRPSSDMAGDIVEKQSIAGFPEGIHQHDNPGRQFQGDK